MLFGHSISVPAGHSYVNHYLSVLMRKTAIRQSAGLRHYLGPFGRSSAVNGGEAAHQMPFFLPPSPSRVRKTQEPAVAIFLVDVVSVALTLPQAILLHGALYLSDSLPLPHVVFSVFCHII